jgi:hypothetical protein
MQVTPASGQLRVACKPYPTRSLERVYSGERTLVDAVEPPCEMSEGAWWYRLVRELPALCACYTLAAFDLDVGLVLQSLQALSGVRITAIQLAAIRIQLAVDWRKSCPRPGPKIAVLTFFKAGTHSAARQLPRDNTGLDLPQTGTCRMKRRPRSRSALMR